MQSSWETIGLIDDNYSIHDSISPDMGTEEDRGMVAICRVAVAAVLEGGDGRSRRDGRHIFRRDRIALLPLRGMGKLRDHSPHQGDAFLLIAPLDILGLKPAWRFGVVLCPVENFVLLNFASSPCSSLEPRPARPVTRLAATLHSIDCFEHSY